MGLRMYQLCIYLNAQHTFESISLDQNKGGKQTEDLGPVCRVSPTVRSTVVPSTVGMMFSI